MLLGSLCEEQAGRVSRESGAHRDIGWSVLVLVLALPLIGVVHFITFLNLNSSSEDLDDSSLHPPSVPAGHMKSRHVETHHNCKALHTWRALA